MCKPKNDGGRRCAAHTRPAFQSAVDEVGAMSHRHGQQDAIVRRVDDVAFHAATPTGAREVEALLATVEASGDDRGLGVMLRVGQNMATGMNLAYDEMEAEIAARSSAPEVPLPATDASPEHAELDRAFLDSANTGGRIKMKDFGVVVHPKREWPIHYLNAHPLRTAAVSPETPVHTTQRDVYADHVVAKGDGSESVVTVALQQVKDADGNRVGQRIWVVDGHHALVAARRAGKPIVVDVHQAGSGDPIEPPRLYTRNRRSASFDSYGYDPEDFDFCALVGDGNTSTE